MQENKKFTAAVVQMGMSKNTDENLKKAKSFIEEAAKKGAKVICLPELFRSPYFCQTEDITNFDLAESIPGKSTGEIGEVAKRHKVSVIVPLFEKKAPGLYFNSIVLIDNNGEIKGKYRKMHIPDDPGFYEKFYFTPGDLGYKSIPVESGNIGTLICWDQWYPEAARLTALEGAEIIFYPTAIGWHPAEKSKHGKKQYESWITVQRGHAIANGVYIAVANRIGTEKVSKDSAGIEFWGQSFICDPQGVIIAQASSDKEEIIMAEIDLDRIEYIRRNWPFLRDRRIDSY
ncbi:MAG: carbon-nitrogen hydrolase, partial [candidate division WOR-3 bacterium]